MNANANDARGKFRSPDDDFDAIDANHDGVIDRREFAAAGSSGGGAGYAASLAKADHTLEMLHATLDLDFSTQHARRQLQQTGSPTSAPNHDDENASWGAPRPDWRLRSSGLGGTSSSFGSSGYGDVVPAGFSAQTRLDRSLACLGGSPQPSAALSRTRHRVAQGLAQGGLRQEEAMIIAAAGERLRQYPPVPAALLAQAGSAGKGKAEVISLIASAASARAAVLIAEQHEEECRIGLAAIQNASGSGMPLLFANAVQGEEKLERARQVVELRRSEAQALAAEAVLAMGRSPAAASSAGEATSQPASVVHSGSGSGSGSGGDLAGMRLLVSKRTMELRTLRTLVDSLEPGPTRDAATQAEQLAARALEATLAQERSAIAAATPPR